MTTIIDIANRSLQALGLQKKISSLTQDSAEAQTLGLIIVPSRRALLRMAPWNCGTKTANLTYITSSPGTPENTSGATTLWQAGQPPPPWNYEYQYPVDCLRPINLIPATQTGFSGGIPITTAVTGGAASFWQGPPVKYQVWTDKFVPVTSAAVVSGGTGYVVGDIWTGPVGDNTLAPIGAPVQLLVAGVSGGGVITSATVISQLPNTATPSGGSYFTAQPNPMTQGTTTGSGTGATFNLTYGLAAPQRVIVTNQEFATMTYVGDVLDPSLMDDQFQEAYVKVLAAQLAMSLSGDLKLANMKINEANQVIAVARVGDGNEGFTINDVTPDWIRIRGIDFVEPYSGPFSGMDWGGMWPVFG